MDVLEPIYPPYMVDVLGPLTLAVIGILRIGVGIYRLELSRSTCKTQSDIYYRMQFFFFSYETVPGAHQLQAKLQCG